MVGLIISCMPLKMFQLSFYFNGVHEDYHRPSDEVDKIDFQKIKKVASLAMATGYYVSNMPERLKKNGGS